jgi:hypothetical protein
MPIPKVEKQVKRSSMITQTIPHGSLSIAKFDAWGVAIVVGVAISVVFLARIVLAALQ